MRRKRGVKATREQRILEEARQGKLHEPLGKAELDEVLREVGWSAAEQTRRWRDQGPLAKPGAPAGNTNAAKGKENKGDNVTFESERGNQASYLARRLLRDAPEVFARLEAGEFPSVRQAAIAAGIVKVPTAIEKAAEVVARLSDAERVELLSRYDRRTGRPLE